MPLDDRDYVRGNHPPACTCASCVSRRLGQWQANQRGENPPRQSASRNPQIGSTSPRPIPSQPSGPHAKARGSGGGKFGAFLAVVFLLFLVWLGWGVWQEYREKGSITLEQDGQATSRQFEATLETVDDQIPSSVSDPVPIASIPIVTPVHTAIPQLSSVEGLPEIACRPDCSWDYEPLVSRVHWVE